MRSWRGFDTSPTMMRVSSFASCIILPVFLKLKTLPNTPYQEAACTHDICHAHNTRNFTKPSDTLTYDICHGQIRRDFTSDKFFPGLYSNAKAHIANKQVLIQATAGGGIQKIEAGASPTSACLSDERIRALAALGAGVEALYETPQDIEWAIDASGQIFLLQARPITTLFPLPAEAPSTDESLRVYLAFGVQQGTYRPFTPMGLSALRLLASGFLTLIGFPLRDPLAGPRFVTEAASRPFFEVTAALRSPFGRGFLMESMAGAEVRAATSFEQLVTDPRLSLRTTPRRTFVRALVLLLVRTRLPWYLLQALLAPQAASRRVQRFVEQVRKNTHQVDASADAAAHLAAAERLLLRCLCLAFRVSPVMLAGMQSFALAQRMLSELASESECQIVLSGSPTNPTTQMNLALWRLSQQIRADATSKQP